MDIQIVVLVLKNGKMPFRDWLETIRDKTTFARIERQIDKLSRGLGVQKGLSGIAELKLDFGPGYRIYYAFLDAKTVVVLLGGGDKSTQSKDISAAKALWKDFEKNGQPDIALQIWREEQDDQRKNPQI
jgi:putative addiction module killer protein